MSNYDSYDLGLGLMDDGSQPSGPAATSTGGSGSSVTVNVPDVSLQISHGIAIIFLVALAFYTGVAYILFRNINQAI
jgi:hypothetical protein